jgi:hypothetical protein
VILLLAILAGVLVGLVRAKHSHQIYQPIPLKHFWLLIAAFLPQVLAFYLPITREVIPEWLAKAYLVSSQVGLLVFVWLNRKLPGMWILGIGLATNLLVIAANGGLMPISSTTVAELYPHLSKEAGLVGSRLGWSKNIVLPASGTHFAFFSDCILLPLRWIPWRYAFSLGDVLISMGVFWLLWAGGSKRVCE